MMKILCSAWFLINFSIVMDAVGFNFPLLKMLVLLTLERNYLRTSFTYDTVHRAVS